MSLVGSQLHRAKDTTTSTNKSLIYSKPVFHILSQRRNYWRVSSWRLSSFEGRLRLLFLGVQIEERKAKWRANGERGDKKGPHHAFPPSTHLRQATKRRLWVHFLERTFSNNDPQKCDRTRFRHFLTCTSCAYFGFIKTTGFVAWVGIAILRVNATVVFNVPVWRSKKSLN